MRPRRALKESAPPSGLDNTGSGPGGGEGVRGRGGVGSSGGAVSTHGGSSGMAAGGAWGSCGGIIPDTGGPSQRRAVSLVSLLQGNGTSSTAGKREKAAPIRSYHEASPPPSPPEALA